MSLRSEQRLFSRYELESLDIDNETVTLRRVSKKSLLSIPRILTDTKLPADAQRELENFLNIL